MMITQLRSLLGLLTPRERRRLALPVLAQTLLALLDVAGIAAMGVSVALLAASVAGPVPPAVEALLNFFGLQVTSTVIMAIACFAAIALILKSIASALVSSRLLDYLAQRDVELSTHLIMDMKVAPLGFVEKRSSQESAYALSAGISSIMTGALASLVQMVSEIILLTVITVGLFAIDAWVALYTLSVFSLVALLLYLVLRKRSLELGEAASKLTISSYEVIQNLVQMYRELRVAQKSDRLIDQYLDVRKLAARNQARFQMMSLVSKYVFEVTIIIAVIGLASFSFSTDSFPAAVGVVTVFLVAASRVAPSLLRLQGSAIQYRAAYAAALPSIDLAAELNDLNQIPKLDQAKYSAISETTVRAGGRGGLRIDIRGASFTYPDQQSPAIGDADLIVYPGERIALVGSSGAGKSTLLDLMLGLIEPAHGEVLLGGYPAHARLLQGLEGVAYVPQRTNILRGSLRQNVALGIPEHEVDDQEVWEALERAQLLTTGLGTIETLDLPLGESGVGFSGGERQRLSLARALYRKPALLVLDEVTSALDPETEYNVMNSLGELKETTMVLVTHRREVMLFCDRLAHVRDGSIHEVGKPIDVISRIAARGAMTGATSSSSPT